jgi:hypothetical protein
MNKRLVAVLWDDHMYVDREAIPKNPDDILVTVLSVGIIYKETDKTLVLVNCIERYEERDDASYTIILKSTIQGIKEYGGIEIEELRE